MQRNLSGINGPFPLIQAALDFLELDRAVSLAKDAVNGNVDWIEVGTPLIKSEGMEAIRVLRKLFPKHVIVADLKTMDAGRVEFESACRAGADAAVVLAAASDSTIIQCVEAGKKFGIKVYCDTIGIADPVKRAVEVEALGVDYIGVHCAVDDQMRGNDPLDSLRVVASAVKIPVAVAGGITAKTASRMVQAGASIIVIGGALHKAVNPAEEALAIRNAVFSDHVGEKKCLSDLSSQKDNTIRSILLGVSTSNLSDAMHHEPAMRGIICRTPTLKMVGKAVTVRTIPGDWSKVVQAIDSAEKGSILVVDAGGNAPAVWGEMATQTAKLKGLSGIVVDGAIRDTDIALSLNFPMFSRLVCSDAGDPKGFGEIGVRILCGERVVEHGDWILGDADGVMVLPSHKAVEYANRARDVTESENRLRQEILSGKSLSELANLSRWEVR